MKNLNFVVLIVTLVFTNFCFATTYYVDAGVGSDNNDGISTSSAWKTIDKVNTTNLLPGDFVLFKRGEIFRGSLTPSKSGTSETYITYGAYGNGDMPKLFASQNRSDPSVWVNQGNNEWKISDLAKLDVGNIIFDDEASTGSKKPNSRVLDQQGEFYSNSKRRQLILYSVGNPGLYYSNIELAQRQNVINLYNVNYLIFENLDIRYGGAHGVGANLVSNIVIRDMNFSYIGGSYLSGTTRYGNGVEFYNAANTATIERCTFNQIYDVAVTVQGDGSYQVYDINFQNNIIESNEQAFEFWVRGNGSSANNIHFENNINTNSGRGWSHTERPNPLGVDILLWGSNAPFNNITVKNNTFSNAIDAGIFVFNDKDATGLYPDLKYPEMTLASNDWNLSLPDTDILGVRVDWIDGTPVLELRNWAKYTSTGQGLNSTFNGSGSNQAPSANAGIDKTITLPTDTVTLNGSGNDNDGTIASYLWAKASGPTADLVNSTTTALTVQNMVEGIYNFQLTVTDNEGATGIDMAKVTVLPDPSENLPPTADAGSDQTITLPINTITLNGSGSDTDGTIVSYSWTKTSGPPADLVNSTSANLSVVNMVEGDYDFQLTVTDNEGATGSDMVQVTVLPEPSGCTGDTFNEFATDDIYTDGAIITNSTKLIIDEAIISLLKFDLTTVCGDLITATLNFKVGKGQSGGNGTFRIFLASHDDWSETNTSNLPVEAAELGSYTGTIDRASELVFSLPALPFGEEVTLIIVMDNGGNPIVVNSSENSKSPPRLEVVTTSSSSLISSGD